MKGDATVDVRGIGVIRRIAKVKKVAKTVERGKIIEVISDDPRMPQLAEKMAKKIGGIEVVRVDKTDGEYHGYFRRI